MLESLAHEGQRFILRPCPGLLPLAVPMSALAQNEPPADAPLEVTLDMDHDGQMDRAVGGEDPPSWRSARLGASTWRRRRKADVAQADLRQESRYRGPGSRSRSQGQGLADHHLLFRLRRQQIMGRDADDRLSRRQISGRRLRGQGLERQMADGSVRSARQLRHQLPHRQGRRLSGSERRQADRGKVHAQVFGKLVG